MTLALYGKTRRRQGGLILAGLLAVFAAMLIAVTVTPNDTAYAATTGTLVPIADGGETAWDDTPDGANDYLTVTEGVCAADTDYLVGSNGDRASFNVSAASIPDGSLVTRVDVTYCYSDNNAAVVLGESITAYARINGTNTDGSANAFTGGSNTPVQSAVQQINVPDFTKTGTSDIEIGVVSNGVGTVRVYAIWAVIQYTLVADADGDGVPDATDQCPNTPPATPVNAVGCSLAQTVPPATVQGPNLVGQCTGLDIHLVVDNSGSIGAANMTTLISQLNAAGTGFIAKVEAGSPSTTWRVTKFQGTNVTSSSAWGNDLASVSAFIAGMNSSGGTPTAAGIQQAINGGLNTAQQNLMIIITDGAPNVTLAGDTGNFTGGAADAIARADAARSAGWTTMVVPIGPGDGSAPGGGNGPWSQAVNQSLAGIPGVSPNGAVFPAGSFDSLADTLLAAIGQGCQRSVIVGKVYDPTSGAPQDGTLFAGSVSNPATPWSGVGFGQFSLPIANLTPTVAHTVTETAPNNGWNPTGFILGSFNAQGLPQCPAYNAVGWLANGTDIVPALPANTTAQAVVCIKNTKTPDTRTIRVVKVTNTSGHPGGTFSGTIAPGGADAANQTWSQSFAANEATSAGETNTVSTGEHTVTENALPANWANSGYLQASPDIGQACSATAAGYTGSSIVVAAGTGNVVVCVRNTYTAPTRTIRVVKVTDTATHPGGTFGGTIVPGGTDAANQAWSQSLGANAANSGAGEINTVSTLAHTVDETAPPANWAETGYYQVADTGTTTCSTTPGQYTGTSAVVGAGTGNVLVCVRNTYTAPTRTVRIQKVTTSAGHPGGAFAGTISPGGTNFDTTWNAALAAAATNAAPGETFITLQTAQDVTELSLPANWTNAGYNVAVDAGQQCSGTEPYTNVGGSAVVPANANNYLVCVNNTYTPPTRTIRVVKVTNTATHPAGDFGGTISDAIAPNDAWAQSLAANAANSGAGEINTVSTATHTVDETNIPANWLEAGYYQVADTGGTLCSTTPGDYNGNSAVVTAGTGNVLVCVRNTFTPPRPTVSKIAGPDQQPGLPGLQAWDATYAYFQLIIDNTAANAIVRDDIVITDAFAEAELVDTTPPSGSGTCVPQGGGAFECDGVAAGATLTLNIRIPLDANPDGVTSCASRQIDNTISTATMSGIPLTITDGGPLDQVRVTAPATASADCITITKVNTGNGTWTVVFANTGPAATVNMMDTYQPFGADNINTIKYQSSGADVPGCTGFQTTLVVNCAPALAGGDGFTPALTTILVTTDPVSIQCGADEVINTVSFTFNGSPAETSEANFPFSGTDCAVPTVSKTAATPAFDGTYAYFQITIDNDFPNAAPRNNIAVTDTIPLAELTSTSGSGSCTPATGVGPWDCDGIAAGGTLTLNIRVPITVAGTNACLERTITNDVTALVAAPDIVPTVSVPAVVVVPGTASADCLSIEKTSTGNGSWEIAITNTGPATTVHVSDTYAPSAGDSVNDVITNVAGCTGAATIAPDGLSFVCSVNAAAGTLQAAAVTTITVSTTPLIAQTCAGSSATNSVSGHWPAADSAAFGSDSAGITFLPTPSACTVTVNLCKQWTTEPGEQVVGGNEDFTFTVGSNDGVVISDVAEGGPEQCVSLSVTVGEFGQGGLVITENGTVSGGDLTGFETPLVSIGGSSPATSASVTLPLDQCVATGFVGQILGLVRSISFLVVQEPPPPSTTPDCTVLFVNDDTENNLPTGNIQVEKYRDNNADGDANDAGEGPIPGWQMTTTCPNDPTNVSDTDGSGVVFIPGLQEAQNCTVTEELPAGWQVTRVTVNGANMGNNTSASVTVPGSGATAYVRFYNRQLGGISVHKTTVNVLNGIETVNTDDDDGWTITVTSAACGIDLAKDTDANGDAVFSGLPLCTDYVVAEIPGSGEPGYTPAGPISVSPVTPTVGGYTQVNFTNETHDFTPPCPNCSGTTPTPTPPTPSPTPPTATATPGTPTATPGTPTVPPATPTTGGGSSPTPVSTVAGDRTPGAGQTPVAPSTGDGGASGGSGLNVLLVLAGLGALAVGLTFMAMGRKSRR